MYTLLLGGAAIDTFNGAVPKMVAGIWVALQKC